MEQSLQQQTAEVTRLSSTAVQTAATSQVEVHRLEQQAQALQQQLANANSVIQEERVQCRQMASALTVAQQDYQVQRLDQIKAQRASRSTTLLLVCHIY